MNEPIKYNETDFEYENEYDFYTSLKYKGQYFTGTVVDDKFLAEFKDGNAHGRVIEYYDNGQMAYDFIFENGNYKSGKEWHPNGQLKSDDIHLYDKEGKLIRVNGCWLYPDGAKRTGYGKDEYYTFSPKGEMAYKLIIRHSHDYKNTVLFFDKVMLECYAELLIKNLYSDYDSNYSPYDTEHYIWGWVIRKYSLDKQFGLQLLEVLKAHSNIGIAGIAGRLLELINTGELDPDAYLRNQGYHTVIL